MKMAHENLYEKLKNCKVIKITTFEKMLQIIIFALLYNLRLKIKIWFFFSIIAQYLDNVNKSRHLNMELNKVYSSCTN